MATHTTPRGFRYPDGSSPAAVPDDIQNLAEDCEAKAAYFLSGPSGSIPAAGIADRYWYETNTGFLKRDTGSVWVVVNPAQVSDGPAGTASLRTLGSGALQAAAGNDARLSDQRTPLNDSVTAAKVNTSLKPSTGAGGGTEALRSLGGGAGQAAAGNDGRLPNSRGQSTVVFPGSSNLSNWTDIPTGIPNDVQITQVGDFGFTPCAWTWRTSSDGFQVRAYCIVGTPAASTAVSFSFTSWL